MVTASLALSQELNAVLIYIPTSVAERRLLLAWHFSPQSITFKCLRNGNS